MLRSEGGCSRDGSASAIPAAAAAVADDLGTLVLQGSAAEGARVNPVSLPDQSHFWTVTLGLSFTRSLTRLSRPA